MYCIKDMEGDEIIKGNFYNLFYSTAMVAYIIRYEDGDFIDFIDESELKTYFITLSELRNQKINKLLYEKDVLY